MSPLKIRLAIVALLCSAAVSPVLAGSSAASSASDSASTSVESLSDSIKKSSHSSSDKDVAQGDYQIIQMAEAAGRPGYSRLTLRAVAADEEFELTLPQAVVAQQRLAIGGVVTANTRPYGIEFSQGQPREAFFLVLADAWFRELQTRPVLL